MNEYKPDILQVRDPVTGEFVPIAAIKGDKGDVGPEGKQGPKGDPGEVTQADFDREIASLSEQIVQSDWNENDPQSKAFVKNRPFYEDVTEEVILPEQVAQFVDMGGLFGSEVPTNETMIMGSTVVVSWDGVKYEQTVTEANIGIDFPAVGNLSLVGQGDNTGEPFLIVASPNPWSLVANNSEASHVVSVNGVTKTPVKIPEKYLPTPAPIIAPNDPSQWTAEEKEQRYGRYNAGQKILFKVPSAVSANAKVIADEYCGEILGASKIGAEYFFTYIIPNKGVAGGCFLYINGERTLIGGEE